LRCRACGLLYYFNPTVAVGAFVFDSQHRLLFVRRAVDPGKGKLGIPGGFVDFGESAEAALRREVREEVGIELAGIAFLCSEPNLYPYRDVTYPTVDLYFTARGSAGRKVKALDGVASFCWLDPFAVPAREIAFVSLKRSLRKLRAGLRRR
jgi:ADP-ribose pyrophosphatase YjhB (NUDIX family)